MRSMITTRIKVLVTSGEQFIATERKSIIASRRKAFAKNNSLYQILVQDIEAARFFTNSH